MDRDCSALVNIGSHSYSDGIELSREEFTPACPIYYPHDDLLPICRFLPERYEKLLRKERALSSPSTAE